MQRINWLTKEEEHKLSSRCQKALRRLRERLGAAISEKATPEVVMSAAQARRPVPPEISEIESARDVLVEKCTPWARNIVRRAYERNDKRSGALDLDDLTQSAMCGLMSAAIRYEAQRGKWSTYCTWWIRQAIGRAMRQESYMIRVPEARQYQLRRNQLDEEETDRIRNIMCTTLKPMTEYLPDRERVAPPGDLLPEMTRLLDKRELEVVLRRFGIGDHTRQTLKDIGAHLKLSRERIRQLQNIALDKLRESKLLREEFEC